jgi:hypothetical protein
MLDSFNQVTGFLDYLLDVANTPSFSSYSGILTFVSILIVSGTISYLFSRFIKNRYLGFLICGMTSIWLYEQVLVKGMSLFSIVVSLVILLVFLGVVGLVVFVLFVKRAPFHFRFPKV